MENETNCNIKGNFAEGRIQFIAHLDYIKNKLEQGNTIKNIYNELIEKKKINTSYTNFARYKVKFLGYSIEVKKKEINQTQKTTSLTNPPAPSSGFSEKKTDKEKFENENKDLSDLA